MGCRFQEWVAWAILRRRDKLSVSESTDAAPSGALRGDNRMSIAWNCPAKLLRCVPVMFLVLLCSRSPAEGAPLTGSQRGQLRAADTMLKRAGNLYRGGKTAEAGKLLDEVQQSLDELKADTSSDMATATEGLTKRLGKARELMKDAGAEQRKPRATPRTPAKQPARSAPARTTRPALASPGRSRRCWWLVAATATSSGRAAN